MTVGTKIIQNGYKKLGVHSIVSEAPQEAIEDGKDILNSMLQKWEDLGIKLGIVPLDAVGNELSEPISVRNAIESNFAIAAASMFSNGRPIITPALKNEARSEFAYVKSMYQKFTVKNRKVSSTLPRGQGNEVSRFDDNFFDTNRELGD